MKSQRERLGGLLTRLPETVCRSMVGLLRRENVGRPLFRQGRYTGLRLSADELSSASEVGRLLGVLEPYYAKQGAEIPAGPAFDSLLEAMTYLVRWRVHARRQMPVDHPDRTEAVAAATRHIREAYGLFHAYVAKHRLRAAHTQLPPLALLNDLVIELPDLLGGRKDDKDDDDDDIPTSPGEVVALCRSTALYPQGFQVFDDWRKQEAHEHAFLSACEAKLAHQFREAKSARTQAARQADLAHRAKVRAAVLEERFLRRQDRRLRARERETAGKDGCTASDGEPMEVDSSEEEGGRKAAEGGRDRGEKERGQNDGYTCAEEGEKDRGQNDGYTCAEEWEKDRGQNDGYTCAGAEEVAALLLDLAFRVDYSKGLL